MYKTDEQNEWSNRPSTCVRLARQQPPLRVALLINTWYLVVNSTRSPGGFLPRSKNYMYDAR